jgi:hypothetical protein
MFAVPAAIACARVGDVDDARELIEAATASTQRWPGTAWTAAVAEARAHLADTEGDHEHASALLEEAETGFAEAGQPRDAARCRQAREELTVGSLPG